MSDISTFPAASAAPTPRPSRGRADPAARERARAARRALLLDSEPPRLSGRLSALRQSSGAVFADVNAGGRLAQACALPPSPAFAVLGGSRLGDWVELEGAWGDTRAGDRALFASDARLVARCEPGFPPWSEPMAEDAARARPDWARASDPRRLGRAHARFSAVAALRGWAAARGLLEAITPILSEEPSGAMARPFWTRSHALDRDLALRVAPENALARLLCSGFEALYEIGPSFRNEGSSRRHHPEFLMMEAYRVGWSARDAYEACEEALRVFWAELGWGPLGAVRHMEIEEALSAFGCPEAALGSPRALREWIDAAGGSIPESASLVELRWAALDLCEPPVDPCAVWGHPPGLSPLAASRPGSPDACERFELYVGGWEVGNGYEQLRDAAVQRARFEQQARLAGSGAEAMGQDLGYLDAMALGMPRFSGFGLGLDRLCALAAGVSIREALPFPLAGG